LRLSSDLDKYEGVFDIVRVENRHFGMKWFFELGEGETEMVEQGAPIDMEELLDIMDGDEELLKECLEDFVGDYPEMLANIRDAVDAGDPSALDGSAHAFKGTLKYLAAGEAADAASQLERMGKDANLEGADESYRRLVEACERLKGFIGNMQP
jgi:histidine phosphotransfer protein HptB